MNRRILMLLSSVFILMTINSCINTPSKLQHQNEKPSGEQNESIIGISRDNIKFSTTNLLFSKNGGEKTIISEGDFWWIQNNINIDGMVMMLSANSTEGIITKSGKAAFAKSSGVIYDDGADMEIQYIEFSWFTITKVEGKKLIINVKENNTGENRNFKLGIQSGNFFTQIDVSQEL